MTGTCKECGKYIWTTQQLMCACGGPYCSIECLMKAHKKHKQNDIEKEDKKI